MDPKLLLVAAYAVAWVLIFIYVLTLNVRLKSIKQEMESLKKK